MDGAKREPSSFVHTTSPTAGCRPNPGHLHQRLPESLAINTDRFHASPFPRLLSTYCERPSSSSCHIYLPAGQLSPPPATLTGQCAVRNTLALPECVDTVSNAFQGLAQVGQ